MISFTMTDSHITVLARGRPYVLARNSPQATLVLEAVRTQLSEDELLRRLNLQECVNTYTCGRIQLTEDGGGTYTHDNGTKEALHPVLAKRLLDCMKTRTPAAILLKFVDRLMKNPSPRAREQLYPFLAYGNMPITPEGTLLAYKAIRHDWTDKHTGKFSNRIGNVLVMNRKHVDDDPSRGCSYGFHVGTLEYVRNFARCYGEPDGDRIIIVEVDPADVVSVPLDCENQKIRTCRYKVIRLYTKPMVSVAVESAEDPNAHAFDIDDDLNGLADRKSVV